MTMTRILSMCLLLCAASACGASVSPYARATAGRIGCPAGNIELDQIEREGDGPESWVAMCGRTAYACSSSSNPNHARARIVCSELGRSGRVARAY